MPHVLPWSLLSWLQVWFFSQFPCRCCYCHTLPKGRACTAKVLCHCVWLCVGGGVHEMLNWKHWQHLFNCKHLSPSHSFMHPVYLLKGALVERENKAVQTWRLQEMANRVNMWGLSLAALLQFHFTFGSPAGVIEQQEKGKSQRMPWRKGSICQSH